MSNYSNKIDNKYKNIVHYYITKYIIMSKPVPDVKFDTEKIDLEKMIEK